MPHYCRTAVLSFFCCVSIWGQEGSTDTRLPTKRVVLYKSGVGSFEHLGAVQGNQSVTVSFTSGQLNDVLKSLTVLDLDGGRITGVGYASPASAERQLDDLRLPVSGQTSLTDFLAAMRGARIEVKSGGQVLSGRLLSIERKTRVGSGVTLDVEHLSLVGDNGEVRTVELAAGFSVRLLEKGLPGKVDKYLDIVSLGRAADVRPMSIATEGTGKRNLFVSYVSEVPVWKSTYRVVLGNQAGSKPFLQGWAIVDNTIGQDWENVELSLVAGAPQSFIQQISKPYFRKRPEISMRDDVLTVPQTFESTLVGGPGRLTGRVTDASGAVVANVSVRVYQGSNLVGTGTTDGLGRYSVTGLPESELRVEFSGNGFRRAELNNVNPGLTREANVTLEVGSVSETVTVTGSSRVSARNRSARPAGTLGPGEGGNMGGGLVPDPAPAYTTEEARALTQMATTAVDLGDLFEYKIKERISIPKGQSALVPIVQAAVEAEKISVWNQGMKRPLRALWLNNSTGNTLDGGTFSVFENETFAGEGIFETLRAGEKRLVSFALDLALTPSTVSNNETSKVTRATLAKGRLTHYSEQRMRATYVFRNEDSKPRTVLIEHPRRPGYTLRGAKPAEESSRWLRFRLEVPAKQTAQLEVEEARPIESSFAVGDISKDQVQVWVRDKKISAAMEELLNSLAKEREGIDEVESAIESREQEYERIEKDQERLRENLKALKSTPEERALVQRYTQTLTSQESRLESLKKEIDGLTAQKDKLEDALAKRINSLDLTADF